MCRAEAQRVYARKGEIEAAGASLQAIVKEDLPAAEPGGKGEVAAFREGFWPDAPIYMNPGLEWYAALHGGGQKKTSMAALLAKALNPFSKLYKNLRRAHGVSGNTIGEGFIHGGVFVVRKGAAKGEPSVYAYAEGEIGDGAPTDTLVQAAKRAASESK